MNIDKFFNVIREEQQQAPFRSAALLRSIKKEIEMAPASATPSPYGRWSWMMQFSRQGIALALIVVLSGGVSIVQASERALPGSFLYPIKVSVAEEFQAFLRGDLEDRAEWEIVRTERRIQEATQLLAEGKLTEKNSQTIARKIEQHSTDVDDIITQIPDKTAEVKLSSHGAHEATLRNQARMLEDVSSSATDKEAVSSLVAVVEQEAREAEESQRKVIQTLLEEDVEPRADDEVADQTKTEETPEEDVLATDTEKQEQQKIAYDEALGRVDALFAHLESFTDFEEIAGDATMQAYIESTLMYQDALQVYEHGLVAESVAVLTSLEQDLQNIVEQYAPKEEVSEESESPTKPEE